VELAGSFSGWNKIPLKHAGAAATGKSPLSFQKATTASAISSREPKAGRPNYCGRETDDFGGENSILTVSCNVKNYVITIWLSFFQWVARPLPHDSQWPGRGLP